MIGPKKPLAGMIGLKKSRPWLPSKIAEAPHTTGTQDVADAMPAIDDLLIEDEEQRVEEDARLEEREATDGAQHIPLEVDSADEDEKVTCR